MVSIKSARNKGYRFQQQIATDIKSFFNLDDFDVISNPKSVTGMDILLSKKAQKVFPFAVECKNQQKLNIWKAIEQAEKNAKDLIPIVVFKKNYEKPYVVLEWKTFLKILKGNKNAKD